MHPRTLAANTARLAGEELTARLTQNGDKLIHQKEYGETVTNFDRAINTLIINELRAHAPEHDIVTEEAKEIDSTSTRDRWFVDPIDGTNNFIRHIPMYAVSIGYEQDGVMTAGAVYDPLNHELFDASLAEGASINGKAMHVSATNNPQQAMVFEGYGYAPEYKTRHVNIVSELNQRKAQARQCVWRYDLSAATALSSVERTRKCPTGKGPSA